MNVRPVGGCSSETQTHPNDIESKLLLLILLLLTAIGFPPGGSVQTSTKKNNETNIQYNNKEQKK
jgi:hypothetical protein